MGLLLGGGIVAAIWVLVGVALRLADRWSGERHVSSYLAARGVTVSWWSVWWYSSRFNATLSRWGRRWPSFWGYWFAGGAVAALGVSVCGSLFMVLNLAWLLQPSARSAAPVMTPMLPFVNVPGSELLSYFAALAIATGLHELGHALAATAHSCAVEGVGLAVVGVLPAAFVDLRGQDLEWASVWVRLKVHCAGAFHNLVLVAAALLLMLALPLLLTPLYARGVLVVNSRCAVPPGFRVAAVNGCEVSSLRDWAACMERVQKDAHQSFCVATTKLAAAGDVHDCCEHDYTGSLQCFHVKSKMYCLSARSLIATNAPRCNMSAPCGAADTCVDTSLPLDDRLLWVEGTPAVHADKQTRELVVMAGSPAWLWQALQLSEHVPRFATRWLAGFDVRLHTALLYVMSLSAALALLNLLPVHYLDGSNVLDAVWQYQGGSPHDPTREWIKTGMTVLVAANLVLSSKSLLSV